MNNTRKSLAVALSCSAIVGCHPVRGGPVPSERMVICPPADCRSGQDVEITYLGVAGFMVRSRDKVLLTAPHFTSPRLGKVAVDIFNRTSVIEADRPLIRELSPKAANEASAILVGHGHYDHLLDVPFIADSLATKAIVYGSPSVRNMLMGDKGLRPRLRAIESSELGSVGHVGDWITTQDGGYRFMALRSSHAPAYLGWFVRFDYAPGTVDTALESLPRRAADWKVGEPYAYIVDVLDAAGKTVFRIYYQDSASDAPLGLPPANIGGRRVDLAILCVASARNARPFAPDELIDSLRPRYVIASHWESFFQPQTERIRRNPASFFREFDESMKLHLPKDAEWSTPMPMSRYRFRAEP